jgi:DNA anti-recombination protein RmuC
MPGEITLLQGLVVYGPLGVLAALGVYGTIYQYRELRDARIAHAAKVEEMAKLFAAAIKATSDEYVKRIEAMGKEHADRVDELSSKHDKRMDEMHTRFTSLAATLVDRSQLLFDKVGSLADSLTRHQR